MITTLTVGSLPDARLVVALIPFILGLRAAGGVDT